MTHADSVLTPSAEITRIAVTGGSGTVGRYVMKELLARGLHAINLDRAQPEERLGEFIYMDIQDRVHLQPVFERVDAVIHLGEIPAVFPGTLPPELFASNARTGSTVMQTAADLKLKRFVYISSCHAYGFAFAQFTGPVPKSRPTRLPWDETEPLNPQNAYGAGKVANETYLKMMTSIAGLSAAIVRLPGVSGHDPARPRGKPKPRGFVDGIGSYVHGIDAARFIVQAATQPRPGCEAYHISADDVRYAEPLRDMLALHHPDYPAIPADWPQHKSLMNCAKAREHYQWKPEFQLHESLG